MVKMTGAIRSLSKGYGFIAGDDGRNYYFHWTGLAVESCDFRDLELRERVSFDVTENAKKKDCPRAIDILTVNRLEEGEEEDGVSENARD